MMESTKRLRKEHNKIKWSYSSWEGSQRPDGKRSDVSLHIFLQYWMFQNNIWIWDKYRGSRGSISLRLCLCVSLSLSPSPQPQALAPARWRGKQPYYKWSAVSASNSFHTQEGCRIVRQLQWPPGLPLSLLWIGKTRAQLERVGRDGEQQALNDSTASAMFV